MYLHIMFLNRNILKISLYFGGFRPKSAIPLGRMDGLVSLDDSDGSV
jgi:hypothetical protein